LIGVDVGFSNTSNFADFQSIQSATEADLVFFNVDHGTGGNNGAESYGLGAGLGVGHWVKPAAQATPAQGFTDRAGPASLAACPLFVVLSLPATV
jgi:hypothetical protein